MNRITPAPAEDIASGILLTTKMRPDRVEEKLRLLRPMLPAKQWNGLRLSYLLEKDFRKRRQLEQMMDLILAQKLPGLVMDQILLPNPEPDQLEGEYQVGQAMYSDSVVGQFGVRRGEWLKHVGIFGKTGSGKTTLAMRLLKEICSHDHPFMIFDYKRNYRDLLEHPEFKNQQILIFTVGRDKVAPFYFNPKVKPPGVEEHVWTKQLAEIIEKVYLLGPGANDVFMESSHLPSFKDMQDQVLRQKKRARELLWWASVKRTLNAINYPGLGEMVNCDKGYDLPQLLNKKVILELDGLSASDQAFVIGSLLLWIYHYRMRQSEREVLKHFLLIEEAHHLFLKTRREEDIADVIMREIRELGESIIIIDQHPSKISDSALGNLGTKFCLTLSLNQDIQAVANAMLLERDQQKFLSMLTLGKTICRSDRLIEPVLLNIPPFPVKKGSVTDDDLKRLMKPYLKELEVSCSFPLKPSGLQQVQTSESLSPLGRIMLENISREPILGLVKRFKKLGLKLGQGYGIIKELTSQGMIIDQTIDGLKLHELSYKGKKALGQRTPLPGRGGLEHRYWVESIKQHYLTQGSFTFLERDNLDLVIESYDSTLAIQVETGKSDIEGNIWRLARFEANRKYMLATNVAAEIKIHQILRDLLVPNKQAIQVNLAKAFLANPPKL